MTFLGVNNNGEKDQPTPQPAPVVVNTEVLPTAEETVESNVNPEEEEVESLDPSAEPQALASGEETLSDEENEAVPVAVPTVDLQTMVVAGGCFWCVESDIEKIPGVLGVVSGYSGGTTENPTYDTYGSGGHREVVEVTYDANRVSFEDILIVAMKTTDPTDDDGTFHDRGDKYSAAFYYENEEQKRIIEELIAEVNLHGPYEKPLAIDVEERATFWPAEAYHQDYYKGTLSKLKYQYYRNASGRDDFIEKHWGENDHSPELPWRNEQIIHNENQTYMWTNYQKPNKDVLENQLDEITYKVTQEEGTEKAGTSPLDKNYEAGIYVDVLSGEPLFSSKDKFDSGTGWPSFTRPITPDAVTEHEDRKLFSVRTEIRSAIADNHLGHVFTDGPQESTGLRYCMNGVALEFIPKGEMEERGYADFIQFVE